MQKDPVDTLARLTSGDKHALPFLLLGVLIGALYAINHWFIQDDAYISFVYSRNFAEGRGLTWGSGIYEYGYTNFFYTLAVGLLMMVGFGPETSAGLLTFTSFIAALCLVFSTAQMLHRERPKADARMLAGVTLLLVAVNYTFTGFASGGLETMPVAMLILLVYHQAARMCWMREKPSPMYFAIPTALCITIRLDSIVLLAPSYLMMLDYAMRNRLPQFSSGREVGYYAFRVALLPAAALALMLGFTSYYYNSALPNTFYVKMPGASENLVSDGVNYFWYYVQAQAYVPLALLAVLIFLRFAGMGAKQQMLHVIAPCIIWVSYVMYFGGDFIEFRMVVPALPFFYLYAVSQIAGPTLDGRRRKALVVLVIVTAASNYYHDRTFNVTPSNFSIRNLNRLLEFPLYNWKQAGLALNQMFYTGRPDDVVIATKAAGAIPYFSRLHVIDQYGLNDHWTAHYGQGVENVRVVGHRRIAPLSYLRQRGVNLVIDHPQFVCNNEIQLHRQTMLKGLPMLLLPINPDCYLVAYYLTPHPRILELMRDHTIVEINQINHFKQIKNEPNG